MDTNICGSCDDVSDATLCSLEPLCCIDELAECNQHCSLLKDGQEDGLFQIETKAQCVVDDDEELGYCG